MTQEHAPKEDAILITKKQAADRYSISLRFLSELIDAGVIPSIRLARKCVRVPVDAADKAIMHYRTGGMTGKAGS